MAKKENIGVRGFFRMQIEEDGRIVGDSGWNENQVTNIGIRDYLVNWLLGDTGNGDSVTHMGIGTGGAPASDATDIAGAPAGSLRQAVSTSVVASRTAQFTAGFASSNSFLTASADISNVGLFNSSDVAAGQVFAGAAFASSAIATNNNLNITYQIRIS